MARTALLLAAGAAGKSVIPIMDWSLDYGYCKAAAPRLRRAQLAPVSSKAEAKNGGMITSCICHGCPWSDLVLEGKTTFQHYFDWSVGKTVGAASMHIDPRLPNGGGALNVLANAAVRAATGLPVHVASAPPAAPAGSSISHRFLENG